MDIDDIQTVLDELSFRPLGHARWHMEASTVDDWREDESIWSTIVGTGIPEALHDSYFVLRLEHWVANSREFDHWDEHCTPELKQQSFTSMNRRPPSHGELRHLVLQRCVESIAHEACEWMIDGAEDDRIFYDPHTEGDPEVLLP